MLHGEKKRAFFVQVKKRAHRKVHCTPYYTPFFPACQVKRKDFFKKLCKMVLTKEKNGV
jgi:hypothetical protein